MQAITGLFDTRDEAMSAVHALEDAGISNDDISLVSRDAGPIVPTSRRVAEGLGVGATVGGVGGLIAGLAAFSAAGVGPIVGIGWLAATLVGATAGGVAGSLIGSLTGVGIEEREAHVYVEGLRRGGTLVTARIDATQAYAARAILTRHNAVDAEARRRLYEADSWDGFAQKDIWDADIGSEDRPETGRRRAV